MALQLAEKLGSLVENNERVFDLKQGVYGGYFNRGEFAPRVSFCGKWTSPILYSLDCVSFAAIALTGRTINVFSLCYRPERWLPTEAILPERYVKPL